MRGVAILLNLVLPGTGSLVLGCWAEALIQAGLVIFAILFTISTFGYGIMLGLPMLLLAWWWGVKTVLRETA